MRRPCAAAIGFVVAIFIAGTVCGFTWFRLTHAEPHDPLLEKCLAASDMQRQMLKCQRTPGCDREKTKQLQLVAIRTWSEAYKSVFYSGVISRSAWECAKRMNQESEIDDLSSRLDDLEFKLQDLEGDIDSLKRR